MGKHKQSKKYTALKGCTIITETTDDISKNIERYQHFPYVVREYLNSSFDATVHPNVGDDYPYAYKYHKPTMLNVYIPFVSPIANHLVFRFKIKKPGFTVGEMRRCDPAMMCNSHHWGWDQFPFPLLDKSVIELTDKGWVLRPYKSTITLIKELKVLSAE